MKYKIPELLPLRIRSTSTCQNGTFAKSTESLKWTHCSNGPGAGDTCNGGADKTNYYICSVGAVDPNPGVDCLYGNTAGRSYCGFGEDTTPL
jgi:hypothetical protein